MQDLNHFQHGRFSRDVLLVHAELSEEKVTSFWLADLLTQIIIPFRV